MQRQLLQCRTCGSQAFHVLDCCRHPDYVRVSTWRLGEKLKAGLAGVQGMLRTWLFRLRQRPEQSVSPEALDAWEARALVIGKAGGLQASQETSTDKAAAQEAEYETVSARR